VTPARSYAALFSADGRFLATVGYGRVIKIWEAPSAQQEVEMKAAAAQAAASAEPNEAMEVLWRTRRPPGPHLTLRWQRADRRARGPGRSLGLHQGCQGGGRIAARCAIVARGGVAKHRQHHFHRLLAAQRPQWRPPPAR
jgi:hypothetical protein